MAKNFKRNPAEMFISAAEAQEAPEAEQADTGLDFDVPKGYKLVREPKSIRMQLLVRPTVKEAIKQEAEAKGISMNDLANIIFEEHFERKAKA